MATAYTANLGLVKPDEEDFVDINALNRNADLIDAAIGAKTRTEVARRDRDPNLPNYGLGVAVVLRTAPYSGAAEIALQVQDDLYDAQNMSARPQEAPSGTIIIRVEED